MRPGPRKRALGTPSDVSRWFYAPVAHSTPSRHRERVSSSTRRLLGTFARKPVMLKADLGPYPQPATGMLKARFSKNPAQWPQVGEKFFDCFGKCIGAISIKIGTRIEDIKCSDEKKCFSRKSIFSYLYATFLV